MEAKVVEIFRTLWAIIPGATEFWAAIAGAVVGGLIAYFVQMKALREGRKQRDEDRKRTQQALGHALLFKMVRIYSNFYGIHRHIEECYEGAAQRGLVAEPWQFILPLVNPPDPVHFSADEMGMLLALRDDDVFNLLLPMDVIHNSLNDGVQVLNAERRALTERLTVLEAEGAVVSSGLDTRQMLALRPRMIEVNDLIVNMRAQAKKDFEEAGEALHGLQKVLREKLAMDLKLEFKVKAEVPHTSARAPDAGR